jgi:hypothetical protein
MPKGARRAGSEATVVCAGAGEAPPDPHLLVLSGSRKGAQVALGEGSTTLGRGKANTAVIPDVAVSRQHVRLERKGREVLVVDLGSGNGTRVNGRPVEREALRHGDALEVGGTRLRLVDPAAPPSALPSRLRDRRLWVGAVAVGVAGAVLCVRAHVAAARAPRAAERASPVGSESSGVPVGSLLAVADTAPAVVVPSVGPRVAARPAAVAAQEKPAAATHVEEVASRGAATEEASIPAAEPSRTQPEKAETHAAHPSRAGRKTHQSRHAENAAPADAPSAPEVQRSRAVYLTGNLPVALEMAARSPRTAAFLEQLRAFAAAYREGSTRQKPAEALRALERAQEIDWSLAQGEDGRFASDLRKAVAGAHLGIASGLVSADEGLPQAAAHVRSALREVPDDAAAAAELALIADRCRDLYLRGYIAKDGDPAAARASFQIVMATLPSEDATAQKAKRWLARLDGKVAE